MAKSKRSKRMRANRRALRDKLVKKDEAKRLAAIKDNLINPDTISLTEAPTNLEDMQVNGTTNSESKYNIRTLKDKAGQFPSWLSGRQRKRLQAKHVSEKKQTKKKKTKTNKKGRIVKNIDQQKKVSSDKPESMLLA